MHLIRLYLPLRDNDGRKFQASVFDAVEQELSHRFGGVTAHRAAPASGLWRQGGHVHEDDIVVLDVLVEGPDKAWWKAYREKLEAEFRQEAILLLMHPVERL
jgi:hypothetical protein